MNIRPTVFCLMLVALMHTGTANSGILNGDFSPDYEHWSGLITGSATTPVDPDNEPAFFAAPVGGLAQLQFDPADFDTFVVDLFQDFSFTGIDQDIAVSFQWNWSPSDSAQDFFQMQLEDGASTAYSFVGALFGEPPDYAAAAVDDLRTDSFLIPAGYFSDASLRFVAQITDIDFDVSDTLQIGNISVSNVPAPATLLLLSVGGLVLTGLRRRAR